MSSANIVGYQKLDLNQGGNTMTAPTFGNVGVNGKFKLSDLTVTGYAPSTYVNEGEDDDPDWWWGGGCRGGNFIIKTLDKSGNPLSQFYWLDYTQGQVKPAAASDVFGPGWYTYASGKYTPATVEQLATEYSQGQAFWIYNNATRAVASVPVGLQPAGQVEKSEVAFNITKGGNTATGVCTPRSVKLRELTVSGYTSSTYVNEGEDDDPDWWWGGGCRGGNFIIKTLDKSGNPLKQFYWLDYTQGQVKPAAASDVFGPGWYTYASGKYTKATEDELDMEFPAGQGFWVYSNATVDTTGGNKNVKLVIPGVDL